MREQFTHFPDWDRMRSEWDENQGKLPAYSWPGGYTIVYYAADNNPFCADCVNTEEQIVFGGTPEHTKDTDKEWLIVEGSCYNEGQPLQCVNCNAKIESTYGDPAENEYVDKALKAYQTAALWLSTDDEGRQLDSIFDISDIHYEDSGKMREDIKKFVKLFWYEDFPVLAEQFGHDFWLTRNGHGTALWSRDYDEAKMLDNLCDANFKEVDIYVGDDGKLHQNP